MRIQCTKCGKKKTIVQRQLRNSNKTADNYLCRDCSVLEPKKIVKRDMSAQRKINFLAKIRKLELEKEITG